MNNIFIFFVLHIFCINIDFKYIKFIKKIMKEKNNIII